MFDELQDLSLNHTGWIEVITGSMFSGKTEELMRRMRRAVIAKKVVKIFKPLIDTRYATDSVVSHDANQIHCVQVASARQILNEVGTADVVGIDEAQFFGSELPDVCRELAEGGVRVVVAGLDMDFQGKPFGAMPQLMATAEFVTKVHAVCACCGAQAHFSHRITDSRQLYVIGEKDVYEPLCRACYMKKMAAGQSGRHICERRVASAAK